MLLREPGSISGLMSLIKKWENMRHEMEDVSLWTAIL